MKVTGMKRLKKWSAVVCVAAVLFTTSMAGEIMEVEGRNIQNQNVDLVQITPEDVSLNQTEFTYGGTERTPTVTVSVNGAELRKDTDYTLVYPSDLINVGVKNVTVIGQGNYEGIVQKEYKIQPKTLRVQSAVAAYDKREYDGTNEIKLEEVMLTGILLSDEGAVKADLTDLKGFIESADVRDEAYKEVSKTDKNTFVYTVEIANKIQGA